MIKKVQNIVNYLAILFVILDCYSVISIVKTNGERVKIFAISLLLVVLILEYLSKKSIQIRKSTVLFLVIYIAIQLFFSLVNNPSSLIQYLLNQILIVVFMMLYFSNDCLKNTFWKKYRNVMFIICSLSIFFYIFGTLLSIVPSSGSISASWGMMNNYKNYFYLYNEAQGTWFFNKSFLRNIGIFAEGPMFAYCTCFSLWYELFLNDFNKVRFFVFVLAIITAFSVTGVLFLCILLFVKYLEYSHKTGKKMTLKRLMFFCLLIVVFISGVFLFFDKIDSISGTSRMTQYLTALKIWKESPFIGVGYRMSNEGGFTSGILLALVECGLWGSLLYLIPMVMVSIIAIQRHEYHYWSITIGFFCILLLTVTPYKIVSLSMTTFLWMYLLDIKIMLNEKEES